jgi:hypothetical protein
MGQSNRSLSLQKLLEVSAGTWLVPNEYEEVAMQKSILTWSSRNFFQRSYFAKEMLCSEARSK